MQSAEDPTLHEASHEDGGRWYTALYGGEPAEIAADALHTLDPEALVWTEGLTSWLPVRSLRTLEVPAPTSSAAAVDDLGWTSAEGQPDTGDLDSAFFASPASAADPLDALFAAPLDSGLDDELFSELADTAPQELHPESPPPPPPPPPTQPQPLAPETESRALQATEPEPQAPQDKERMSGFGRVLWELVETERSYLVCLDQLLHSYRPALQALAPTVLGPLFGGLDALHVRSPLRDMPSDISPLRSALWDLRL